ncbi:MAG: Kua-ubiquitin conjugating enzyme hybrid localization domain-containing protein [Monoraphidium minutum]|nr:MAG: Kua-ubiquitin conjugating enzyme hybrid localization domain-containing protein [Monoraphidium minutum]
MAVTITELLPARAAAAAKALAPAGAKGGGAVQELTRAEGLTYTQASRQRTAAPLPRHYAGVVLYALLTAATLWRHRALLTGAAAAAAPGAAACQLLAGLALGWAAADFSTGALHILLDHPRVRAWPRPIGGIATDFQVHHHFPRLLCTSHWLVQLNFPMLCGIIVTAATLAPRWAPASPAPLAALLAFGLGGSVSNLSHRWAHMLPAELPRPAAAAQAAGLLVSRAAHLRHHAGAHDRSFCILCGWCNGLLDAVYPWVAPSDAGQARAAALLAACLASPFAVMWAAHSPRG